MKIENNNYENLIFAFAPIKFNYINLQKENS